MTDKEEYETIELKQSETTNITQRKNLLQQKQLEAQTIKHSLSCYVESLCEKYDVDVEDVVSMKEGRLIIDNG